MKSYNAPYSANDMTPKGRIGRKTSRSLKSKPTPAEGLPDIFALPIAVYLQNTNAGVLVSDERHRFVWGNNVFMEYFNTGPYKGNMIDKAFRPMIDYCAAHLTDPVAFELKMKELKRRKKPFFGWELTFKTGHIREISYIPVFDDGRFAGSIWQIVDVTRHRQWQEELIRTDEKYRVILDNLNAALCETDLDGVIVKVYESFCRLSGYTEDELIGRNITDIFVPEENREYARNLRRYRVEKKVALLYDMEIVLKDGSRKWVLASSGNIYDRDGNAVGGVGIHMDITPQKVLQMELEAAKQAAEEAQRTQKEFLANMSHEIRTPLNAIIGMAHLLDETTLDDEQKEYIKILKHSSGILHGLITDILDISKIEAGKQEINAREFDLKELITSMKNTFQLKLGQRPVKVTVDLDKRIDTLLIGDDMILNQILMNLLGNAEKFTKEGEIAIKVTLDDIQGNALWLKFMICDTGIGIQKDKLELIFHNYKQAEKDIRERYGGTGLGLAIAKQLVELQGGQISVEEGPVYRTCFSFNLPFIDTRKRSVHVADGDLENKYSKIDFGNARVLVVEDNAMNLKYILSLLEKYRINYQLATNGPDALYFLESRQYDLVLMDIRIPGMDGFELAKKIREDESRPNVATPVIATTAAAMPSTIALARNIGITDILTKPYTPDQLLQVLNKYLNEDETEIIMEVQNLSGYEFHAGLDVRYLNTLYESNIGYAIDLFEIFVMTNKEEVGKLQALADNKDWDGLKFQVHKIKPNFSMVGLTWITSKMETLENCLNKAVSLETIPVMLQEITDELKGLFPIIEQELQKMYEFVKTQER
ncbi:PAS domain S-box protein [Chitinophaga sp. SYP-B3965]|uniref:PAS domain S-box protein n=1 Tax=Chitinophaga sp. SYP-B3965 TaxID=2663120 RepID=UPI001299A242|nr:PAS domain S-box protein [Chitinophaga sp. SYP-B3965]MRG45675.1 PAS domain S-box protein [Chitinophaga sp. SYP-B3965]